MTFYNTIARAFPVISLPLLQRFVYSPEEFGIYGFFFTIASISGTFFSFNYDVLTSLLVKEGQYLRANIAFSLILLFFIIVFIISLIFSFFVINSSSIKLGFLLGIIAGVLMALSDFFSIFISATGRYIIAGKATLYNALINEILRWLGLFIPQGFILIIARVVSFIFSIFYIIYHLYDIYQPALITQFSLLLKFFKKYFFIQKYLWTSSIMSTFTMQIPILYYKILGKMDIVGYITISAAYFLGLSYFISKGIQQVVFSRLTQRNFSLEKITFKKIFLFFLLYLLIGFIIFILPDEIILKVLGLKWIPLKKFMFLVYLYAVLAAFYWILYPCITFFNLMKVQWMLEIFRLIISVLVGLIMSFLPVAEEYIWLFSLIQCIHFSLLIFLIFKKERYMRMNKA